MTLGLVQARKSSSPVLGAIPILRKQKDWVGGGRIFFADVQYYLCCRMVGGRVNDQICADVMNYELLDQVICKTDHKSLRITNFGKAGKVGWSWL